MLPPLSKRQKAVLSVSLALLLLAPSTLATHDEQTLVTGHTTFYNGAKYDECMASVAGIVRSQVMWFNDMVLAERYAGKGTYIWITESGAPDPRRGTAYSEGVTYTFTDPNGVPWTVQELFWFEDGVDITAHAKVPTDVEQAKDYEAPTIREIEDGIQANRTYMWVVELSAVPIYDMFAGNDPANAHTYYNFVNLVDTCKMRTNRTQPGKETNPEHWNVTHDTPEELNKEHGHRNGESPHTHEAKMADIWLGKQPNVMLLPGEGSVDGAQWQSKWATGETGGPSQDAQGGAHETAQNPPPPPGAP